MDVTKGVTNVTSSMKNSLREIYASTVSQCFFHCEKLSPMKSMRAVGAFKVLHLPLIFFCGLWKPSVNTTTRLWRVVVDIKTVNAYWSLCQIVLTVRTLHCALCSVTFFVDKMCAITMQIATLSTQFPTNAQFVGEPFDAIPTVTVKEVTNIIT